MRKALAVSLVFCFASSSLLECGATPRPSLIAATLQDNSSSYQEFSPDQLDNLLAPIALYPDPLLAQVLLAATFVDQIDEAARCLRANRDPGYIDSQPWDVSVKAVAHYPAVLNMMADKIDWTTALGQAYVNQSTDVMTAVQRLRRMANSQGNLATTPEQQVIVEPDYIQIVPAQPRVIYVPVYDPGVVYVRRRPSWGTVLISFGIGLAIGAWLNRDCDWRDRRVYYHGWRGGGWIERSRPVINVTNVYINNRYTNITVNRTVVNRTVNYTTINRYNNVHRNVTYNNLVRNRTTVGPGIQVHNKIINRNIHTNDPRLDTYRGRVNQGRPMPVTPGRPQNQTYNPPATSPQPVYRSAPHTFGRSEGGFDPRVSSQRGQTSRTEANRPSRPPAVRESTPRGGVGQTERGRSEKGRSDRSSGGRH